MKAVSDRCRILIVDPFDREGSPLSGVFDNRSTIDVVWAADARSAAATIAAGNIRVIISEFCLPDATAAQLCKQLRQNPQVDKFFVYSALGRDIDRTESIESGAAGFFIVPDESRQIEAAAIACFPQLRFENPFVNAQYSTERGRSNSFRRQRPRTFRRRVGGII